MEESALADERAILGCDKIPVELSIGGRIGGRHGFGERYRLVPAAGERMVAQLVEFGRDGGAGLDAGSAPGGGTGRIAPRVVAVSCSIARKERLVQFEGPPSRLRVFSRIARAIGLQACRIGAWVGHCFLPRSATGVRFMHQPRVPHTHSCLQGTPETQRRISLICGIILYEELLTRYLRAPSAIAIDRERLIVVTL